MNISGGIERARSFVCNGFAVVVVVVVAVYVIVVIVLFMLCLLQLFEASNGLFALVSLFFLSFFLGVDGWSNDGDSDQFVTV